ncbi:MAG TPA: HD domain-containing protein [Clostridia bacterium]|nr:MAG: 5'-nucleotidase [Firmicutes bacterium ADurb.Bin099]HNZ40277.1 HD domain-containing protein [Clostridia bacterium]
MKPDDFLQWLHVIEKMKCNFRHSKTSCGREESVAEHSYRLILMAYVLKDTIPDVDMDRVVEMCIVHDIGEAITGDIPSFRKTKEDDKKEMEQVLEFIRQLPEERYQHIKELFSEIEQKKTKEAIVFKALDKMEAVIQHNEADISTWLDIEYELQKTYGTEEAQVCEFLKTLRNQVLKDTEEKIEKSKRE